MESILLVIDNFLNPTSELYAQVRDNSLWKEHTDGQFYWIESGAKARNSFETLSQKIWNNKILVSIHEDNYAGIEYWTNEQQETFEGQPWHVDTDEYSAFVNKTIFTPWLGSIYYAHDNTPTGGELIIDRNGKQDSIAPIPNRLIVFEPGLFSHKVCGGHGARKSIVSNLWIDKPNPSNYVSNKFKEGKTFPKLKIVKNNYGKLKFKGVEK